MTHQVGLEALDPDLTLTLTLRYNDRPISGRASRLSQHDSEWGSTANKKKKKKIFGRV